MKVLLINGSPRVNGNTSLALSQMTEIFKANNIEVDCVQVGNMNIRGCIACASCHNGKEGCVINDIVNELAPRFKECDGMVIASPVYYASANATLVACLDRLFYSTSFDKRMKVGASIAVARRGGCSATFDQLNKYFTISQMLIVGSQYWNQIHGNNAEEARQDLEGMQTMCTLGRNMAYLLNCLEAGRQAGVALPETEEKQKTNFIR